MFLTRDARYKKTNLSVNQMDFQLFYILLLDHFSSEKFLKLAVYKTSLKEVGGGRREVTHLVQKLKIIISL